MSSLTSKQGLSVGAKQSHGARSCICPQCKPSLLARSQRSVRPAPRSVTVMATAAQDKAQQRIAKLLQNNEKWASAQVKYDPAFFNRLRDQQSPEYLWIGCADSRVPANTIVGLDPGRVFVQRNVGNQASHMDLNVQACIEFSVKALKVKTIILCGHYKCGAVKAALTLPSKTPGLVNCWISDIREARNQHLADLKGLNEEEQVEKLCEYNVLRQVFHVCTSPTVQEAWDAGIELNVYGMCYSLEDGLLQQLCGPITNNSGLGTADQEVFVAKSLEKRKGFRATIRSLLPGGKPAEQEADKQAVNASPKSPVELNTLKVTQKLSQHAAWDKRS